MTTSVVKEANASSASDNRACSDRRCGEDECGSGEMIRARNRDSSKTRFLHYGGGLREKLLHLWRFRAYSPSL